MLTVKLLVEEVKVQMGTINIFIFILFPDNKKLLLSGKPSVEKSYILVESGMKFLQSFLFKSLHALSDHVDNKRKRRTKRNVLSFLSFSWEPREMLTQDQAA